MNWQIVISAIWEALNSPVGVSLVVSVALWAINKLYTAKPAWQAYEGAIIKAIQFAEREIPDDIENKHLRRADAALQYVLAAYERINGQRANAKMREQLAQGIEIVHTDLETLGVI